MGFSVRSASSRGAAESWRTSTPAPCGRKATCPRKLLDEVFEVCDRNWRGLGLVPASGYTLRPAYRALDAEQIYQVDQIKTEESAVCISGQVLKGLKKPHHCPAFGTLCTPQNPLGATMVSSEGACAAYYAYGRHLETSAPAALQTAQV